MENKEETLVECPECGKRCYVQKKDIEVKTKCSYCKNWVVKVENKMEKGEAWRQGYQQGIKEEKKAWIKGERCHNCGKPKLRNLTELCDKCLENE